MKPDSRKAGRVHTTPTHVRKSVGNFHLVNETFGKETVPVYAYWSWMSSRMQSNPFHSRIRSCVEYRNQLDPIGNPS